MASPLTAYCTFTKPRTPSASAMRRVVSRSFSCKDSEKENGGMHVAESPEWMPASSMCSKMPPM